MSNVDAETRTAICAECGPVKLKRTGTLKNGKPKFRCKKAWRAQCPRTPRPKLMRRLRGSHCENPECTATIVHPSQLDVHHKDGNHSNNDLANIETLCANCHRLHHWGTNAEDPQAITA